MFLHKGFFLSYAYDMVVLHGEGDSQTTYQQYFVISYVPLLIHTVRQACLVWVFLQVEV